MKLIVGLGNPTKKYRSTRHNIGFMFIDMVVSALKGTFSLDKEKKAEIYIHNINGEKIIFMKPQTFMNLSGEAVEAVMKYYKIELDDLLVIHDDLDLPTGKVRIRKNGSGGGHNGVKNIILHIKSEEFKRIRIGIDKDGDVIDYVLGTFSKAEKEIIDVTIAQAPDIIKDYLYHDFDYIMNKYN